MAKLSLEEIKELYKLSQQGWNPYELAEKYKIDRSSVLYHVRRGKEGKIGTHALKGRKIKKPEPEKQKKESPKELLPPEKINKGKASYMDYVKDYAGRHKKTLKEIMPYQYKWTDRES